MPVVDTGLRRYDKRGKSVESDLPVGAAALPLAVSPHPSLPASGGGLKKGRGRAKRELAPSDSLPRLRGRVRVGAQDKGCCGARSLVEDCRPHCTGKLIT